MQHNQANEQLNMAFNFSKEIKANNEMTKKDVFILGSVVTLIFSFIGVVGASKNTVIKTSPANKFVTTILETPKEVNQPSTLLDNKLPNLFKYSLTDSDGHRYILLEPYLRLMKELATEEKQLLDNNASFNINKFDKIIVNNYLLNDEFYFKAILILKDSIPAPTLMHIIKSHFFLTKGYNELSKDIYDKAEEDLLASDNIHQIYIGMKQLDLDKDTKLKYAIRLEKLIAIKVKNGTEQWDKYLDKQDSFLLNIQEGHFKRKSIIAYDTILEDIYKVHNPNEIMTDSELDKFLAYKEKILMLD